MSAIFDCQMCGHCCQGRGGIILSARDLARLADFLHLREADFIARYVEHRRGKLCIRSGSDGSCVFFREGVGCAVHPAKPDVCRAWPFFRGNLVDPVSLALAKDACPGIRKDAAFSQFAKFGLEYLESEGLLADPGDLRAANVLKVANLLAAGQWS